MKQFKNRCSYFELEYMLDQNIEFEEKVKTVKLVSDWAASQIGMSDHDKEAYAQAHIANIVRENQVTKMLQRIQKDLLDHSITVKDEDIIQYSIDALKSLHGRLSQEKL